jgi:hypothetical protein
LLAEEESSHTKKASPKPGAKKAAAKPAGPGAIAAAAAEPVAAAESAESPGKNGGEPQEIESFSATGIDNALDLAEVVTAKMDKASIGNQAAATIEKHPEVRDPQVHTSWLLNLTFGHFPAAETIQGAFLFPLSFCRVFLSS